MRQLLIGCLLTSLVVVGALVGGGALYYYVFHDVLSELGFDDFDAPEPGIHIGEGVLAKRSIPLDNRIDWVTDVVFGELDSLPGEDIGVASAEGILVLDGEFNRKSYAPIVEYVDEIRFVYVPSQERHFVYNVRSWDGDDAVALFDLTGKQLWTFDNPDGPAVMKAGDLDGDGDPEFCVSYANNDETETLIVLNADGSERWRKEVEYLWDYALGDVTGDGEDDICALNESDRLVIERASGPSEPIADVPMFEASLLCIVDWPVSGTGAKTVLLAFDERFRAIDASGNTVRDFEAPDLDYPDGIYAATVTFRRDGPKHLAVIASGYYPQEFTQFYVYGPEGELIYYEVLNAFTSALLPLYSEQGEGRIIVGGDDELLEFTLAGPVPESPNE